MLNKKNIKILFTIISVILFWTIITYADMQRDIIPNTSTISEIAKDWWQWVWVIWSILNYIKESIFWLLAVISIWMFLYVGFNLVKAQWNPEEMSKAWKTLIHVIVWLFIVAVSWALVVLVSWLKI